MCLRRSKVKQSVRKLRLIPVTTTIAPNFYFSSLYLTLPNHDLIPKSLDVFQPNIQQVYEA